MFLREASNEGSSELKIRGTTQGRKGRRLRLALMQIQLEFESVKVTFSRYGDPGPSECRLWNGSRPIAPPPVRF
jgi:hypothetical protein